VNTIKKLKLTVIGPAEAYLLGAQPPLAPALELLDAASGQVEVGPTEAAVLEWLHLVPLLFCAVPPTAGGDLKGSPFLAQELLEVTSFVR